MRYLNFPTRVCASLLSGFLLAMVLLEPAHSTIYYVSKDGDDSIMCQGAQDDEAKPLRKIQTGMACLASGDVLEIKEGIWGVSIANTANNFPDGTPGNLTTIRGAEGENVILKGNSGMHILYFNNCGSYTRIENIEFDGTGLGDVQGSNAVKFTGSDGAVGVEFVNNIIHDVPDNGMFVFHTTRNFLIENNVVYDNGRSVGQPGHDDTANNLYLEGSGHIVRNNRVYYNSIPAGANLGGIRLGNNSGDGEGANGNVIENNYVSGGRSGIIFGTGDNNIVRNNIVANIESHSASRGILLWTQGTWSHDGNKIYNNTVYNAPSCLRISPDSGNVLTNSEVRNNILYDCSVAIDDMNSRLSPSNNTNNLTTDPLFVTDPFPLNPVAEDFQVQSGSQALDMGIILADVLEDYKAVPRPQGTAYDIGAYEFQGSGGDPPPAPPTGLVTSVAGTTITLNWAANAEPDLQGYTVFIGTVSGSYGPPISVGNVLTYQASSLQLGTTYYFALTAVDTGGNQSALSTNEANATTDSSPIVTVPPNNQTVTEPETVNFHVEASGTAPLSYQWQRDGTDIAGATNQNYSLATTTVTADNGASFTVRVTNAVGSITSTPAVLTVNPSASYPPPIISPAPGSTLESRTITFTGGHTSQDEQHWLSVGSTPQGNQFYHQSLGTGHTVTVGEPPLLPLLPTSGMLHVRYWTYKNGSGWEWKDYIYTMLVP